MDKTDNFKTKLKRAYEFGRLKSSLWPLIPAMIFACLGVEVCHSDDLAICLSVIIGVSAIFFLWKGGNFGKAVIPALLLSTLAIVGPYLAHAAGICCQYGAELQICIGTGLVLGFVHGYAPARNKNLGFKYLFAGLVIIGVGGAIGCSYMGMAGVAGVLVGILVGSLSPFILFRSWA